jgi:hypothetical protein
MHRTFTAIFIILLLAACTFLQSTPATRTATADSQNCFYAWATQPLPDLTEKVQSAINAAGLKDVSATALAYGENCVDPRTNQPRGFTIMETDFHISAKVADLTKINNLGGLLEKILAVLDAFPPGKIPGPQPGTIAISFQSGKAEAHLSFTISAGKSARLLGLHGEELFEKLKEK